MIRAGATSEINTESGEWLILDIGFANKSKSCGLLINERGPEEMQFSEAAHGYEPMPEVNSLEEFLALVEADEYCCFKG
jgi:hypothetical protein